MAGLDGTGKTPTNSRANRFTEILSFSIDDAAPITPIDQSTSNRIPLASIQLPARQPRRYFDPDRQAELIASIREHGILENLLVRPQDGQYELVAGERRYRAAQEIGLADVPVTILELTDQQALEIALIENLQREDLNPVEETEGILLLLARRLGESIEEVTALLYQMRNEEQGKITHNVVSSDRAHTVKELFSVLGRISWQSFASHRLPLLRLPNDVLIALQQGRIEYTKAKAIASLKDDDKRQALLQEAIDLRLSLSQIRERLRELKQTSDPDPDRSLVENRAAEILRIIPKSQFWDNPKKRQKVEQLLNQLNKILLE